MVKDNLNKDDNESTNISDDAAEDFFAEVDEHEPAEMEIVFHSQDRDTKENNDE